MTKLEHVTNLETGSEADAGPRVKDLTQTGARITIETDGAGIYDMILAIWSVFDPDEDHSSFELGKKWFTELAASVPPDLRDELMFLGGPGEGAWLGVAALIATSPYPHDIDTVLDWLAQVDPIELRSAILVHKCMPGHEALPLARRAAAGDEGALEEFLAQGSLADHPPAADAYRTLMQVPGEELRDRVVASLRRFRIEVYKPFEEDFKSATARAAAAHRALVRGADPERVIEEVTNGLDYRIQPGVARLILVPSVVLRPWALIDQHVDILIVVHPVADEFLNADPDAPPSWIVKLHKALGDERRLRILRRISEGEAGLEELSEMLGLSKSTVHHHVGLLRGAGLIRVSFNPDGSSKSYTLRRSVLPEAARTLDDYLIATDPRSQP